MTKGADETANIQGKARAGGKAAHLPARPAAPNWFRLGYLIHDVSRMRRTLFDHHLKPLGITRSQWWLLANLSRSPDQDSGVMSSDLARQMDVGKVTLGGLVDRLESAGYVVRRSGQADRRAKMIFITSDGYALIEHMKGITETLNRAICEGLLPDEIAGVEQRLSLLKDNLRQMLADDGIKENSVAVPPKKRKS